MRTYHLKGQSATLDSHPKEPKTSSKFHQLLMKASDQFSLSSSKKRGALNLRRISHQTTNSLPIGATEYFYTVLPKKTSKRRQKK